MIPKYKIGIVLVRTILMSITLVLCASASYGIQRIIGITSECNLGFAGCSPIPTTFTVLCNQFVGSNCPKKFHPSWVDTNRYWGATDNNCVTSLDGGVTWGLCAVQPFGATSTEIASSANGNVIAVSSVAGVCTIKLSVNNGASWTTQFTDANQCLPSPSSSLTLRCQPDDLFSGQCDYVFVSVGVGVRAYRSLDNGVSWTQTFVANVVAQAINGMAFDGTLGMAGGSISLGVPAVVATAGTWGLGSGWPAASNNYGVSSSAIWNSVGAPRAFAFDGGSTFQYKMLTSDGAVVKSFIPIGARITGFPTLDCIEYKVNIDYCVGVSITNTQNFWVSLNDLTTSFLLGSNVITAGRATLYSVNGGIYISVADVVGGFYKIT